MGRLRTSASVAIGISLAAMTSVGVATAHAASAPVRIRLDVDDETFEACGEARTLSGLPSARDARRTAKAFKQLDAKKARKTIASALAGADSKKDRKAAFKKAVKWCRAEDAYLTAGLTAPARVDVVDTTTATVSGTTTPGATVTAGTASATADAAGNFSIDIAGLVAGENRIQLRAEAELRYPTTKSIVISQSESEFAFKLSTGPISYDELIKDPDALIGRRVTSRAQVFQFDSRTGPDALLVSVTQEQPGQFEFWTDNVFLTLPDAALGAGIDNGDIIEFWGEVAGAYDYETAAGGTNSVPSVLVRFMTLVEKREE